MNGAAPGKARSAGIDLLLFVVTLGVYWFVWMYKAFDEVARARGRDIRAGMWVSAMAVVWIIGLVVGIVGGVTMFLEQAERAESAAEPPSFAEIFQPEFTPMVIAGMGISAVFYILQTVYLRNANQVTNDVLLSTGLPPGPTPVLALTFNVLFIAGQIPFVGVFASLGGLVVAIVWVIQVQEAINRLWAGRGYGAPPPPAAGSPMGGWTPATPPQGPPARPPPPPPVRRP